MSVKKLYDNNNIWDRESKSETKTLMNYCWRGHRRMDYIGFQWKAEYREWRSLAWKKHLWNCGTIIWVI